MLPRFESWIPGENTWELCGHRVGYLLFPGSLFPITISQKRIDLCQKRSLIKIANYWPNRTCISVVVKWIKPNTLEERILWQQFEQKIFTSIALVVNRNKRNLPPSLLILLFVFPSDPLLDTYRRIITFLSRFFLLSTWNRISNTFNSSDIKVGTPFAFKYDLYTHFRCHKLREWSTCLNGTQNTCFPQRVIV